jgi:hypothetical protein
MNLTDEDKRTRPLGMVLRDHFAHCFDVQELPETLGSAVLVLCVIALCIALAVRL